jgi:hypothetical protein
MRRSITFTLAISLGLFVAGAAFGGTADASPGGVHAAQGRGRKKHHRPKSHRHARPKSTQTSAAGPSKKNDRGFEL